MHETIGLLGGTFNPIHLGHLAMARAARDELRLDRMIILPDGDPPHKSADLADKRHRLRMVELAAAGAFEVSAMEVDRPGKTYSVDTLEALRALYPDASLYMIIGADTLHELHTWRNFPRVASLCQFAVFRREGLPLIEVEGARLIPMESVIPDISSTDLRRRVHRGDSLEAHTPKAVEDYIGLHRLYGPPPLQSRDAIEKRLREILPKKRFHHIQGVEKAIRVLAQRWQYPDIGKAVLTGLLHDCAKGMSLEAMTRYVDDRGLVVDALRRETVALLHAPASAAMARAAFGVTDPEILTAIRYHNTGRPAMGTLDKLVYLADMTEPGRPPAPELETLRALALTDLDAALATAMEAKLDYITQRGQFAHPDTQAALAYMQNPIATAERKETI